MTAETVGKEILALLRDLSHEEAIRLLRELTDFLTVTAQLEQQAEARVPWGEDP